MPRGGKRPGAGRPHGSQNRDTAALRAALSDLMQAHVDVAIATLADIAQNGASESARVSASVAILDRTFGKPGMAPDFVDDTVEGPTEIVIYAAEVLEALRRKHADGSRPLG